MAYTSVIPVHRLDRSIEYVKDKEKTTQKADSLEAAIDYAMNRTKTEQAVFEDTIGCTNENAYEDMLTTKKRFHKMGGVEGYHLVQSFAEGEVTPELAHLIGQELADRLLKGQFEVVITTHLNTRHYHNHIVWNSVSMVDGHKYHRMLRVIIRRSVRFPMTCAENMVCLSLNPIRKNQSLMYSGKQNRKENRHGEWRSVWISGNRYRKATPGHNS